MVHKRRVSEEDLRKGWDMVQEDAWAYAHALTCMNCGLRAEALLLLGILGKTEADFWDTMLSDLND